MSSENNSAHSFTEGHETPERMHERVTAVQAQDNFNCQHWDAALTEAIEFNDGKIQPYTKILEFLSKHYEIRGK